MNNRTKFIQTLRRHKINDRTLSTILGDVRTHVEKHGRLYGTRLVEDLTGISLHMPRNNKHAVHLTQSVIVQIHKNPDIDPNEAITAAKEYYEAYSTNPANQWMYVEKEYTSSEGTTNVTITDEVDVQVPVKADGSIKKGGRAILIEELYRKYVLEGTEPVTRKQMIDLFVKEVGMTPAGASTYFANAKSKFGDPKGLIQSGRGKK